MKKIIREISLNWKSGLTVALVSIPLSLSLAIASGTTPIVGIITAVWAGIAAAMFGGSRFNVVGPAAALSGILGAFVLTHGPALLPIIAILAGVLIFIFYILRWDRYLIFIPSSVMHGFTLGVGLTIGLGQLNFALGLQGLPVHESFIQNLYESLTHISQALPSTFVLFATLLCLLFCIARWFPRIPGAVVVAVVGIAIGYASEAHLLPFTVQTLFSKYGAFHATLIQIPTFSLASIDLALVKVSATVAVVAVLETLLSAKIVDGMTNTRFDQKKEMLGLSIANVLSGLLGGMPATGVLARTALNAKSGATSSFSSGLNAVFILVIALLLFSGFQYLPLAAVGSILVFAAVRMVELEHFHKLFAFDPSAFWLAMLVAVLTFAVDPMIGILVGATVALLSFAHHISKGHSELTLHKDKKLVARIPYHRLDEYEGNDVVVYRFSGELTYFNGEYHEDAIKRIDAKTIILSLRNLFYIDLDGAETLRTIIDEQKERGCSVYVTGISEYILPMLETASWFVRKEKEGRIFKSTTDALRFLGFPLGA